MKNMKKTGLSRRDMLKLSAGSVGAAVVLVACGSGGDAAEDPTAEPATDSSSEEVVDSPTEAPPAPEVAEVVMMYLANEISDDEIAQFNADHDNINLSRIDVDMTRFFAMYASGEAPDLVRSMAPDLPQWKARNIMLELDSYFDASTVLKRDDLAAVNNYYKLNSPTDVGSGPIYGMAKDWAPDNILWVNENTFAAAGVDAPDWSTPPTAQELAETAQAVTVKDGEAYTITGFGGHTGFIDRWWQYLTKSGGSNFFSDDFTKTNLVGNKAAEDAVAFFHDLAVAGAMNSPINPSAAWFGPDFVEGRLAITYTGYWYFGNLVNDPNEDFQAALADGKIKAFPSMTWEGTRSNPCITAAGAIITKTTQNPDAAWRAFEWFMGEEPALNRAGGGWGLPALTSLYDLVPQDGVFASQVWETVQSELPYAEDVLQFNPYLAGGEPAVPGQVFMDNWEQLLNDEISFDDMLGKIESETNIALEEGQDRIG